jgi:hypothetical protein
MKVALATSHGRMAPCLAGVDLLVIDQALADQSGAVGIMRGGARDSSGNGRDAKAALESGQVFSTHGWHSLAWGRELMLRDVTLLLCAGVDHWTWAAIRGHGIRVIPNAFGETDVVVSAWRNGQLSSHRVWPAYPVGFVGVGGFGARRGRFRGGRR